MNRFNLTFRGEIIEGHDPAQVRTSLAQMLEIDDPVLLQRCFSGDPVVLRRNLERKEAAELYARLRRVGIRVDLVKIGERGDLHAGETATTSATAQTEKPSEQPGSAPESAPEPQAESPTAKQQSPAAANSSDTGHNWPTGAAVAAGNSADPAKKGNAKKAKKAIRRADLAAKKELQAEQVAVLKAKEKTLKKALQTKENEEAKRSRISEQAQKKTLAREAKHKAKLAAAKRKAELTEKKRKADASAAERKARQEREQAEAAAKHQAELELARAEEASRQEEKCRLVAEKADEAARRKAEEVIRKAREQERQRAEEDDQQTQRRAMEEQAVQRAATELAHKPGLKQVEARVKTRLETPSIKRRSGEGADESKRRKQPGAPNLYSLRPFRNTPEIRDRAALSTRAMRLAYTIATIAFVVAAALGMRLLTLPPAVEFSGPDAIAIAPPERLLLVVGEHLLLHDRSGVSVSQVSFDSLGLANLYAPLAFDSAGKLLAAGQLVSATVVSGNPATSSLLRCDLAQPDCKIFSPALAGTVISSLAVHPTDGSLFIADASAGQLLKVSADGSVLARAAIDLPPRPVLQLDSGLLMISSALGPGISVYRYEDSAFGQQLDEVLLLPDADEAGEFTAVTDFIRNGEYWWAILDKAPGDTPGLYRFDAQWQFVDRPPLAPGTHPRQLAKWGDRTLVQDPAQIALQRFNSAGAAETAMVSTGLTQLLEEQGQRSNLALFGWRIALALCLLVAIAGVCMGSLHRVRSLVYTSCRERGAAPVDELADNIDWVDVAPDRATSFSRTGMAYLALASGLVLGAIGVGASSIQLSALLLALTGPAIALLLLQRSEAGHIGISGEQLLLVDHGGMYHFAGGGRIHHRGHFLMIDDVTVFTGALLLPAFAPAAVRDRVMPIATDGVKVDRKIVTVKLLQARHPLALGAVAILATGASAIALLSLHGIF